MTDFNFVRKDNRDLFNYHNEKIPYISFKSLDKLNFIKNAVTLRNDSKNDPVKLFCVGGTSAKEAERWNDEFLPQIGSDRAHLVECQQKHTANVHLVAKEDLGTDISGTHILNTDALITDIEEAVLVVKTADCIPLMFVDPENYAIGIAHAGRKGTMNSIGAEVVRAMEEEFHSRPEDMICTVGPGICKECYEVGDEIFDELAGCWGPFVANKLMTRHGEKYHLDLILANKLVLMEAGVRSENIYISNICNRCNCDKMYSYRGDRGIINEIGTYIKILKEV